MMPREDTFAGSWEEPLAAETTAELLGRAKSGDQQALAHLMERCLPALRRWAHGRIPRWSRGMLETADLVQDAVVGALGHLEVFEYRRQGALQAYLREAVMNRIRDLVRQQQRRGLQEELPDDLEDEATSPLDRAIGADNIARYEAALGRLDSMDREAIIGRLELQYAYKDLATVLDKPSADAARMTVVRALRRLAAEMHHA
jgi:RNA polymerase sigma-70 factor (ECF subfamily)